MAVRGFVYSNFEKRCAQEDEEDRLALLPTVPAPDKLFQAMDLLMDLKAEGRIESWHIRFPGGAAE